MRALFGALDVSAQSTAICIVDENEAPILQASVATHPSAIAKAIAPYRRRLKLLAQETSGLAPRLHRELEKKKLPMACLDARSTRESPAQ
jgi:hypothetical protein